MSYLVLEFFSPFSIAITSLGEWVRFFEGQVYEYGRFWNTGSHTRTKITPVTTTPLPRGKNSAQIYISLISA